MDKWHKKELSNQGTKELRSIIKDELEIDNKSILDDFTNHITVAGAIFFNKCWSTEVLFSRLLEREYQETVPSYTHILPHPLFLLLSDIQETDTYILATTTPNYVPKIEYESLYNVLNGKNGAYKIPPYKLAQQYLTILLDLI